MLNVTCAEGLSRIECRIGRRAAKLIAPIIAMTITLARLHFDRATRWIDRRALSRIPLFPCRRSFHFWGASALVLVANDVSTFAPP